MKLRNKMYAIILMSLFLAISVQPYITHAVQANQKDSKIFLAAKPSRIVNQHYTVLDAKLEGFSNDGWIPITNQELQFFIEINSVWTILGNAITDEIGHAQLKIFVELPENQYLVKALFLGNLFYKECSDEKHINVLEEAHDVILSEPQYVAPWGDPITFSARITNPAGNPIPNRALNFSIYLETPDFTGWIPLPSFFNVSQDAAGNPLIEIQYNLKTNKTGWATQIYTSPPNLGEFDLKVSFQGGKSNGIGEKIFWNAFKVIKRSSIIQGDSFIGYYGDPTTLTTKLIDHESRGITDANVNIYLKESEVSGWILLSTVNTGSTSDIIYTFTSTLAPGTYPIKFEFTGNALYTPVIKETLLEIKRELTAINHNSIEVSVAYTDTTNINIFFGDDEGNPLSNKLLNIYISYDFMTYSLLTSGVTDINGDIFITYIATSHPGTYSLLTEYLGDSNYQPSLLYGTLSISKEISKIINVQDITYNPSGDYTFGATLLEDDGPPISGVDITFSLKYGNDEIIVPGSAQSNSAGVVSHPANVPLDAAIPYTIFAKYTGNEYYFPGIGHDSVLIPPKPAFISVTAHQLTSGMIQIDLLVRDENNNPVPQVSIDITISKGGSSNEIIKAITVADGSATATYNPQTYVGSLTITVWSSSSNYLINPVITTLSTRQGIGLSIGHWIVFVTHSNEMVWWEWTNLALALAAVYGPLIALSAFLSWIEPGDWLQGLVKAAYTTTMGILAAVTQTAVVTGLIAYYDAYEQLEFKLDSLDRLGVDVTFWASSLQHAGEEYVSLESVATKLDAIWPTYSSFGLIIVGEYYRSAVKTWFDSHPTSKDKLYLTILDYDWSTHDKNTYSKGYTLAFAQFAGWWARNDFLKNFVDQAIKLLPSTNKAPEDVIYITTQAYYSYDAWQWGWLGALGFALTIAGIVPAWGISPPSVILVGLLSAVLYRYALWRCQTFLYWNNVKAADLSAG